MESGSVKGTLYSPREGRGHNVSVSFGALFCFLPEWFGHSLKSQMAPQAVATPALSQVISSSPETTGSFYSCSLSALLPFCAATWVCSSARCLVTSPLLPTGSPGTFLGPPHSHWSYLLILVRRGLFSLSTIAICTRYFFVGWGLCIAGRLAASLVSTHEMPSATLILVVTVTNVSRCGQMSLGEKSHPL